MILTPRVVRSQADADRVLVEESKRVNWLRSDVNRIIGPADLYKIVPGASLPATHVPLQAHPAVCPDGTPIIGGPGQVIAPQIPGGPLLPLPVNDPSAPPKDFGVVPPAPPPGPPTGPQPQSGPGTVLPAADADGAAGGPAADGPATGRADAQPGELHRAAQPDQDQPPQGKDASKWKLFHRN